MSCAGEFNFSARHSEQFCLASRHWDSTRRVNFQAARKLLAARDHPVHSAPTFKRREGCLLRGIIRCIQL